MMDSYRSWVRRNRQWISSFESLASTATWFLPERFADSELTPEAVSTLLGLVTVMNQHIIETTPPPLPRGSGVDPRHRAEPGPGSGPGPGVEKGDAIPWALCITVVKEVEVLTEMVAEYYLGKDKKWGPVASVEAIKAIMRLIILKNSGYKMLLDGGETKNVGDIAAPAEVSSSSPHGRSQPDLGSRPPYNPPNAHLRREGFNPGFYPRDLEGRAMQAMYNFNSNVAGPSRPSWLTRQQQVAPEEEFRPQDLFSRSQRAGSTEQSRETQTISSRAFVRGEVLLISRPLLYVLLVWRYGLRSWRPWVAALSIDLVGMYLVSSSTSLPERSLGLTPGGALNNNTRQPHQQQQQQQDSHTPLSTSEELELRKRKLRWAFYVLRDPFFNRFARRPVQAAEKMLSPVPLLGMLAGKAVDLLLGVQGIYSYTAAS